MSNRHIAERLGVMRHLYYVPDASEAEDKAVLLVWAQALDGIPEPFVAESFREWFAKATHRPSPGHIRKRAEELIEHARTRRENLRPRRFGEAEPEPEDPEARLRRQILADDLAKEFQILKRMPRAVDPGTGEDGDK